MHRVRNYFPISLNTRHIQKCYKYKFMSYQFFPMMKCFWENLKIQTKIKFIEQLFVHIPDSKFHWNPFRSYEAETCRQTNKCIDKNDLPPMYFTLYTVKLKNVTMFTTFLNFLAQPPVCECPYDRMPLNDDEMNVIPQNHQVIPYANILYHFHCILSGIM